MKARMSCAGSEPAETPIPAPADPAGAPPVTVNWTLMSEARTLKTRMPATGQRSANAPP